MTAQETPGSCSLILNDNEKTHTASSHVLHFFTDIFDMDYETEIFL